MLSKLAVKTISGTPCGTRFKHFQSALVPQSPLQDRQYRFESIRDSTASAEVAVPKGLQATWSTSPSRGCVLKGTREEWRQWRARHGHVVYGTCRSEDDTQRAFAGPTWMCLELRRVPTVSCFFRAKNMFPSDSK